MFCYRPPLLASYTEVRMTTDVNALAARLASATAHEHATERSVSAILEGKDRDNDTHLTLAEKRAARGE